MSVSHYWCIVIVRVLVDCYVSISELELEITQKNSRLILSELCVCYECYILCVVSVRFLLIVCQHCELEHERAQRSNLKFIQIAFII